MDLVAVADIEDQGAAVERERIGAEVGAGRRGGAGADVGHEDHVLRARRAEDVADGSKGRGNLADVSERDLWSKAGHQHGGPIRLCYVAIRLRPLASPDGAPLRDGEPVRELCLLHRRGALVHRDELLDWHRGRRRGQRNSGGCPLGRGRDEDRAADLWHPAGEEVRVERDHLVAPGHLDSEKLRLDEELCPDAPRAQRGEVERLQSRYPAAEAELLALLEVVPRRRRLEDQSIWGDAREQRLAPGISGTGVREMPAGRAPLRGRVAIRVHLVIGADVTELLSLSLHSLPEGGLAGLDGERLDRICCYLHDASHLAELGALEKDGAWNEEDAGGGHLRKSIRREEYSGDR